MGTPFRKVYETFLSKIEQGEWDFTTELGTLEEDWFMLLKSSINRFMFPRKSLEYNDTDMYFFEELGEPEIQVLATFMLNEWLHRGLASWTLIKQEYSTSDFKLTSQANHMDKLKQLCEYSDYDCKRATNLYSRVREHKPVDWSSKFAGGKYGK